MRRSYHTIDAGTSGDVGVVAVARRQARVLLNRAVLDIISQFENCPDDCTSRDGKRMRHYIQIDSKLSA